MIVHPAKDAEPPDRPGGGQARRRPGRPRLEAPSVEYLERREEILAKASEVFDAKGYDAGTLEDVAQAMGMRKAGLYHYVQSKSHLLFLLFDRAWELGFQRIADLSTIEDPGERLAELIRRHVGLVAEQKSLFTVFFGHRPRFDDAAERTFLERERRYVGVFARAVRDAAEAGLIPRVDPRRGAMALLGMTSWVYKWYDPAGASPEQIADDFVLLVLREHARPRRRGRHEARGTGADGGEGATGRR
ncbi:MAG TPA: TetR/AcrR family transcriptional regulator [Candidatus Dormibacteraeota bacterium]|jgi:AcrR family transcriptional regulator|nr:TetR/AcrR family transcriptional regulator [Candidatus Dormibacteraeota bacterium]